MKSKFDTMNMPTDRKFGFFFTLVFSAFAIFFYIKKFHYAFLILGLVAIIFLITTLFKAKLLRPLNKLWMNLGLLMGKIVSPIVMGFIFFFIFTPISSILKLIGRDELFIKFKNKPSFWVKYNETDHANSFKNQF